tara:strand:+ start:186 stop:419 length:234 start_codon:yes stop_codon:yes gene_type:complete
MGKATEFHGIPHLLEGTPPSPEQLWKVVARMNAIKAILIKADLTTEEDFIRLEKGYLRGITTKRTEKIRKATFAESK